MKEFFILRTKLTFFFLMRLKWILTYSLETQSALIPICFLSSKAYCCVARWPFNWSLSQISHTSVSLFRVFCCFKNTFNVPEKSLLLCTSVSGPFMKSRYWEQSSKIDGIKLKLVRTLFGPNLNPRSMLFGVIIVLLIVACLYLSSDGKWSLWNC